MSKKPYISVWLKTRNTLDNILTGQVRFRYYIPILLSVISGSVTGFKDILVLFDQTNFAIVLITLLILIMLGFSILTHLFPWLILRIGKIWKGKSNIHELRVVIGLAQIPVLLILLEQIVHLAFGELKADWEMNIGLQWVVWIFSTRILIIGIARVQGFSYGIAVLNLVMCLLPLIILRLMFI